MKANAHTDYWMAGLKLISAVDDIDLERIGNLWGFKRRWWESLYRFRKRMLREISRRGFNQEGAK
jgi:hypothetical protein